MKAWITIGATLLVVNSVVIVEVRMNRRYQCVGYGAGEYVPLTVVYTLMAAGLVLQPLLLPALSWRVLWGYSAVPGVLTAAFAHAVHAWARCHLGTMYSYRAITEPGQHYLVDTGPYRYIRNPLYISYSLFGLSLAIINLSWLTGLVLLGSMAYLGYFIKQEEVELAQHVAGYVEYCQRTPRFIPHSEQLFRFHGQNGRQLIGQGDIGRTEHHCYPRGGQLEPMDD